MTDIEDILFETFLAILEDKVDVDALREVCTKKKRRLLYERITAEVFYKLLKEQKLPLLPGFGSVVIKERKEKDKKVYDRKTKQMVVKHIRGKKVVYLPGDLIKEFI